MSVTTTQGYKYNLVAGTLPNTVILDTFSDEDIKISNNITQLFDIGSVPGTFSRTITLPGTAKNNKFFEHYYDISLYEPDVFNTNQKVSAYLDFGGVFLVNGYLQLDKVNVYENKFIDSYEINLFGAISNFSVDTTKLFLNDLTNLSIYNHTSSYQNIKDSWSSNLFNGDIVYPMADYGQRIQYSTQVFVGIDDVEDAMTVQDYKPAMRMKVIWDAIFEKVGFTYTGSFMEQEWIDDVYVFLNANKRYPLYNEYNLETFGLGKVFNNVGSTNPLLMTNGVEYDFTFNAIQFDNNNLFSVGSPTFYNQQVESRLSANIGLSFRVSGSGAGSGMPAWYLHYYDESNNLINTQVLANLNEYLFNVAQSRSTTTDEVYFFNTQINIPTIPVGKFKIKIEYVPQITNNFTVTLNPSTARELCTFEITEIRQGGDQLVFDVPLNMPYGQKGIRLIDFIRAIQKKFNLVIYEDKTASNRFVVETFNTWYKEGTIRNFNNYINLDQKIEFLPANNLAVNIVSFSDLQDADFVSKTFQQINNRTFGQSFFQDTDSYFSQGEFKVESTFASGPLAQVGFTGFSGSSAVGQKCNTYFVINLDPNNTDLYVNWIDCTSGASLQRLLDNQFSSTSVCSRTVPTVTGGSTFFQIRNDGDCSPLPDTQPEGSTLPMSIPIYIGDQNYAPTRVQPRIMFYNGQVSCSQYYIEHKTPPTVGSVFYSLQNTYPYFDNYNVVTGSFPSTGSRSLLFNNEESSRFGSIPEKSLVQEYWATYLELLYNPRTRLVNASAVLPLPDYFQIELNDLVQFRGNYYHLRAINDYNLTTGECLVQLLGPVIPDAVSFQLVPLPSGGEFTCDFNNDFDIEGCAPTTTSTTTTTTTVPPTTTTTTTTTTTSTTTTTTTAAPAYNYYTFTPCAGGGSTDYRSLSSLSLGAFYAFSPGSSVACYEITSITAGVNTNDLPTLYGPKSGCADADCIQL